MKQCLPSLSELTDFWIVDYSDPVICFKREVFNEDPKLPANEYFQTYRTINYKAYEKVVKERDELKVALEFFTG